MACRQFFYKKFWHLVGPKIQEEVLRVLNDAVMAEGWNETTIVLIPKVKNPESYAIPANQSM